MASRRKKASTLVEAGEERLKQASARVKAEGAAFKRAAPNVTARLQAGAQTVREAASNPRAAFASLRDTVDTATRAPTGGTILDARGNPVTSEATRLQRAGTAARGAAADVLERGKRLASGVSGTARTGAATVSDVARSSGDTVQRAVNAAKGAARNVGGAARDVGQRIERARGNIKGLETRIGEAKTAFGADPSKANRQRLVQLQRRRGALQRGAAALDSGRLKAQQTATRVARDAPGAVREATQQARGAAGRAVQGARAVGQKVTEGARAVGQKVAEGARAVGQKGAASAVGSAPGSATPPKGILRRVGAGAGGFAVGAARNSAAGVGLEEVARLATDIGGSEFNPIVGGARLTANNVARNDVVSPQTLAEAPEVFERQAQEAEALGDTEQAARLRRSALRRADVGQSTAENTIPAARARETLGSLFRDPNSALATGARELAAGGDLSTAARLAAQRNSLAGLVVDAPDPTRIRADFSAAPETQPRFPAPGNPPTTAPPAPTPPVVQNANTTGQQSVTDVDPEAAAANARLQRSQQVEDAVGRVAGGIQRGGPERSFALPGGRLQAAGLRGGGADPTQLPAGSGFIEGPDGRRTIIDTGPPRAPQRISRASGGGARRPQVPLVAGNFAGAIAPLVDGRPTGGSRTSTRDLIAGSRLALEERKLGEQTRQNLIEGLGNEDTAPIVRNTIAQRALNLGDPESVNMARASLIGSLAQMGSDFDFNPFTGGRGPGDFLGDLMAGRSVSTAGLSGNFRGFELDGNDILAPTGQTLGRLGQLEAGEATLLRQLIAADNTQ